MSPESRPNQPISAETRPNQEAISEDTQVLKKQFGQALKKLMQNRNIPQSTLSSEICKNHTHLSQWTLGYIIPSPLYMGRLLESLKLEGEELDNIIEPWREIYKRNYQVKKERGLSLGQLSRENKGRSATRKAPGSKIGEWIDEVVKYKKINLSILSENIESKSISNWRTGKSQPDLDSISSLVNYADKEELPEELKEKLRQIITDIIAEHLKIYSLSPSRNRAVQKITPCVTYTGGQAGKNLGVSRERISQIRQELGIENLLLTQEDYQRVERKLKESEKHHVHRGPRKSSA